MTIKNTIKLLLTFCIIVSIFGCQANKQQLTDAEANAILSICGVNADEFNDITSDVLTKETAEKFPAVSKVYKYEHLFAFIVKPIAYNGPITLALVINGNEDHNIGLRIIEHVETPHYVRDMESAWFMDRFADKPIDNYLTLARNIARSEQDIVAITGATVTTEAVINGVNAAFGVYQEYVYSITAQDVPYMVRFTPGRGDGPVETGVISIRAYGVVIAEVSLEDIRALPSVIRTMSIHSSSGVTTHKFRGTLLSNVLNLVDTALVEEYHIAIAVGVDDYLSGIRMEEIIMENNVFVMYEDNDEPLLRKDGEPGAMRVVVINDVFGQRFTNNLIEIVLESEVLTG